MTISRCPHVSVTSSQVETVAFLSTETILVRPEAAYCITSVLRIHMEMNLIFFVDKIVIDQKVKMWVL